MMKKLLGLFIGMLIACEVQAASAPHLVLVFPFENLSAHSDVGWLSEGIAELLSRRLQSPSSYVIGRAERNAAFEQLGFPSGAPLTLASEYKVAATLGVQEAIVGSFTVTGNKLTSRAQLLDLRRLSLSRPFEVSGDLGDMVALETNLAWRLLAFYDPDFTTGSESDFGRRFPSIRLDAFENYIRGVLATDGKTRLHFLEEADRLAPADHRAAFELGRYYFGQKNYAQAVPWFKRLDPGDANYSESVFLSGVSQFFLGHNADAQAAFEGLARRLPLDEVLNNLGAIEMRQGHYAQACAEFERARKADPVDLDYNFNLAVCSWYLKQYAQAVQFLKEDLRSRDDDAAVHSLLAAIYGEIGDAPGRRGELAWLSKRGEPPRAAATQDFSSLARVKKTYDGRAFRLLALAIQSAEESRLAREPASEHGQVHLGRGRVFLSKGQFADAERELAEAVSLLPSSGEAHLLLGEVYESQGKYEAAAGQLETALNLQDSAPAHLWLARAYLALHRPQAARDQTQAVLRADPANREAVILNQQITSLSATGGKAP